MHQPTARIPTPSLLLFEIETDSRADKAGENWQPYIEQVLEVRDGINVVVNGENPERDILSNEGDAKHYDEPDCKGSCSLGFTLLFGIWERGVRRRLKTTPVIFLHRLRW